MSMRDEDSCDLCGDGCEHADDYAKDCRGLWGLLFGHRFEAAYDEDVRFPDSFKAEIATPEILEAAKSRKRTCRGYICRRCGEARNAPHVPFTQKFSEEK